jgi:hypothetical protein
MADRKHSQAEQDKVIRAVNPGWLNLDQDAQEITRQFNGAYELWRGLGTALENYLKWEQAQV